jgi:hypothetical protein
MVMLILSSNKTHKNKVNIIYVVRVGTVVVGKQTWAIIFKSSVPDPDPGTIFSKSKEIGGKG